MWFSHDCDIMQGSIYHQLAAADSVNLDAEAGGSKAFSISGLTGDYRRIIHRPKDLEWKFIHYSDANEPLALSELEELTGITLPETQQQGMVLVTLQFSILMQVGLCQSNLGRLAGTAFLEIQQQGMLPNAR